MSDERSYEDVSLREYLESRLESMQRAVEKVEASTDRRFEAVNEMRAMVSDAAQNYMPRLEYETAHRGVVEKIEALQKLIWVGLGIVAALQFAVSIMLVVWRHI